ncbi:hypothetical protein [Hymenobacter sp. BT730]|uniref:hypothetical protein n=1 Tax=Hymenobacter sp. BT730 TaxID=3063332 RepID=UPI0026E08D9A|nr:hypothetical protein [Hymenobacter sp. BT730]
MDNHAEHLERTVIALTDGINHGLHSHLEPALESIDGWVETLQNNHGSAAMVAELQSLKGYLQNGDTLELSQSLQRLGQETSKMAAHLHNNLGDQLRHLGQTLIMAAGNMKVSH